MGEEEVLHALGDRPVEDVFGVSRKKATRLRDIGITTIAQLAETDVLALSPRLGVDVLRLFSYKARAKSIATFDVDNTPFNVIRNWKLAKILQESRESLVSTTGQPEAAIVQLKDELAKLAATLDRRVLRQLKLADVG